MVAHGTQGLPDEELGPQPCGLPSLSIPHWLSGADAQLKHVFILLLK